MEESSLYNQPPVSARGSLLLAALGLVCLGAGLFAGAALLIPAGLAGLTGLLAGMARFVRSPLQPMAQLAEPGGC